MKSKENNLKSTEMVMRKFNFTAFLLLLIVIILAFVCSIPIYPDFYKSTSWDELHHHFESSVVQIPPQTSQYLEDAEHSFYLDGRGISAKVIGYLVSSKIGALGENVHCTIYCEPIAPSATEIKFSNEDVVRKQASDSVSYQFEKENYLYCYVFVFPQSKESNQEDFAKLDVIFQALVSELVG